MSKWIKIGLLLFLYLIVTIYGSAIAEPEGEEEYFVYLPLLANPLPLPPDINSFTATPALIAPGQSSTLAWNVSRATNLEITPGVGSVSGSSIQVQPTTTTQYTLIATNNSGSVTAYTTVTVTGNQDEGALFLPALSNVNDPVLARDATGGLHMAYNPTSSASGGDYPVHYAYCPGNCDEVGSWTAVAVGNAGWLGEVARVALTPQGKPRLMWFFQDTLSQDGVFIYAACEQNCTNATNWALLPLTTAFVSSGEGRYFTLDNQGRPRFVYSDIEGQHTGTYYAFCDANCTTINNWYETKISDNYLMGGFSLTYDSNGHIRLAYNDGSAFPPDKLSYAECDTACELTANWHFANLYEVGDAYDFVLQVDSFGRPRLVLYAGYYGDNRDNRLHYFWCNNNCMTASNWSSYDLGLPDGYGINVDMVLDGQNRPHLAYATDIYYSEHIDYLRCTANCETLSATWQSMIVETSQEVNVATPPAVCSLAYWYIGKRPSLVLDPAGNPRIAYNADCGSVKLVRIAVFNQPGNN